jgi:hypothetical protein
MVGLFWSIFVHLKILNLNLQFKLSQIFPCLFLRLLENKNINLLLPYYMYFTKKEKILYLLFLELFLILFWYLKNILL